MNDLLRNNGRLVSHPKADTGSGAGGCWETRSSTVPPCADAPDSA